MTRQCPGATLRCIRSVRPAVIEKNLKQRDWKIRDTLDELRVRRVGETKLLSVISNLYTFCNINQPEDLVDISGS